jgi:two-component system, OmpR family, response regulator
MRLTGGDEAMITCPMPRTVLVVDDDPHIRQLLVFALEKAGLATREAADGEAALAAVAAGAPDLVVLDINMPRMDGLEVCRRLRALPPSRGGDVAILFLSSRDDEIDRVVGIELGADDYVVKPFSPREVVARVQAVLRRAAAPAPPPVGEAQRIRHGALSLDLDGWTAAWKGAEVPLTVTEFSILRTLVSHPAKVFSRDAIIDRLHGPGFAITDRTVDSHVRNLRAKFAGIGATDVVETRPGIGYRLGACEAA